MSIEITFQIWVPPSRGELIGKELACQAELPSVPQHGNSVTVLKGDVCRSVRHVHFSAEDGVLVGLTNCFNDEVGALKDLGWKELT